MKTFIMLLLIFGGISPIAMHAQDTIIDNYIATGLQNNLALKQLKLDYEKSLLALKEAKSMFYPDISLNARYSVADGGRLIEIPVGDLMNPVYSTLNQLLQQELFPAIENEKIPFLRPHEQETKLRLVQPLFNTSVWYNFRINNDLADAGLVDVEIFKRELVAEIKKAYFNYLKTVRIKELYENTLPLLEENLRVNKSLYENDKVTYDVVLRSKAELSNMLQEQAEAVRQFHRAAGYFNFLINRDPGHAIDTSGRYPIRFPEMDLADITKTALGSREEFNKLDKFISAGNLKLKMETANRFPTLTGVVDYGIEGEEYILNSGSDFIMASLVLQWGIFSGYQKKTRAQKAAIELQKLTEQETEVRKQVELQVIDAYYDLVASYSSIKAAHDSEASNSMAFKMVNKKYVNGKANMLEFIDARTSMTNSSLARIITEYDYQVKMAEFERVTATASLNY